MDMPREDFLRVRELMAEQGMEVTPEELLEDFREVSEAGFQIVDEPGLVSFIRDQKDKS